MKKLIFILMFVVCPLSVFAQADTDADTETESTQTVEESAETPETTEDSGDVEATTADDSAQTFEPIAGTVSSKTICSLNNDTREISIVRDPEGPSSVVYKKNGEENTIAVAKNDPSYVDRVVEKIVTNLEAANFSCESDSGTVGGDEGGPSTTETDSGSEEVQESEETEEE